MLNHHRLGGLATEPGTPDRVVQPFEVGPERCVRVDHTRGLLRR